MNWKVKNNKLTAELDFESQTKLAEFLVQIAKKADELNHHPDIFVTKGFHLNLELFTHSENKITELDYEMAEIIDGLNLFNVV